MYSEALTIMDRNTVKYMCEEQQKMIDELSEAIAEKDKQTAAALAEKNNALNEKDKQIAELMAKLQAQNK